VHHRRVRLNPEQPSAGNLRALSWTTALLGLLTLALYLLVGSGPQLPALPWFNPMVLTFQVLTCTAVAGLAFGRFRVLRDPTSYWTGIGFCLYGVVLVFYVLAWPGLLPDGSSILGRLPGTAAWFPAVSGTALSGCLFAAARAGRPGPQPRSDWH